MESVRTIMPRVWPIAEADMNKEYRREQVEFAQDVIAERKRAARSVEMYWDESGEVIVVHRSDCMAVTPDLSEAVVLFHLMRNAPVVEEVQP